MHIFNFNSKTIDSKIHLAHLENILFKEEVVWTMSSRSSDLLISSDSHNVIIKIDKIKNRSGFLTMRMSCTFGYMTIFEKETGVGGFEKKDEMYKAIAKNALECFYESLYKDKLMYKNILHLNTSPEKNIKSIELLKMLDNYSL